MTDMKLRIVHASEVDATFMQGMADRMAVSYHKYGAVKDGAPKLDCVQSAIQRFREYAKTGNTEFLIDAANFAMMEFMFPKRDGAHFTPTDADASPGRINASTGRPDKRDNEALDR